MSILFMEGFEDVKGPADLQARGEYGAAGNLGPAPARYAGGNALVRGGFGAVQFMSRAIASPNGEGIYHSFQGYLSSTSGNFGNQGRTYGPWYANGQWLASQSSVSSIVFRSSDGVNWESITTNTTTNPLQSICWDPNRSRYTAVANSNNSTTGTIWHSSDLVTWTSGGNMTNSSSQQTWGILYVPGTGHILILSNNYLWRLAAGASAPSVVATVASSRPYHIVSDGDNGVWFVDTSNAVRRSLDGGGTFETAGTIRGGQGYLAWLDSKLYAGTNLGIDYSTDNGSTFTQTTNASTPTGVMLLTRLGTTFYARSTNTSTLNDHLWTSPDGLSWSLKPDPLMSNPIGYTTGVDFVNVNNRLYFMSAGSNTTPISSDDGEAWSYLPNSGLVITNPSKGNMNGVYPQSSANWTHFGTTLLSTGGGTLLISAPNGTVSSASGVIPQRDKWYLTESSLVRTGSSSYQFSVNFDGTEVFSSNFTLADYTGSTLTGLSGLIPMDSNGTTMVACSGTSIGTITPSTNFVTYNTTSISPNNITWSGRNFILCAPNTIYVSNDPANGAGWRLVMTTASSTPQSTGVSPTAIIVGNVGSITANLGRIWRSTDHGETWVSQVLPDWPAGAGVGKVMYLNGLWMISGSVAGAPWYYSTDDGLTWQQNLGIPLYGAFGVQTNISEAFGKIYAPFADPTVDTAFRVYEISVSGTTISYELVSSLSSFTGTASIYNAFNGKTLIVPTGLQTGTGYATEDGVTWTPYTMSNPSSASFTGVACAFARAFISCTAVASGHRLFAPTALDYPMATSLDFRSWSHFDDVLISDNVAPFQGPQGEARVMKIPLDQTVAAEWAPNPSNLTNLEAATAQTASIATSYIESNEVGQEDVYGTSSFSVPPGYRAAAVQVEGYYSRTLNTIPSARFGVRSGSATDATPAVDVTAAIGSKVYVSKVVQQDPATGANWTVSGIANAKITNERTS